MQKLFVIITVPLAAACLAFILLYVFMPQQNLSKASDENLRVVHDTAPTVSISSPIQLAIHTIDVTAEVTPVGLTSEGDMAIDENPEQVAWYKFGPKPGEQGSAVLAGHYGWKNGVPSVFNDLNKLVKGDEISMMSESGQMMTFVVTRTEVYSPEQDATYVFKSDDGKSHLNLITCQGSWNNTLSTYSERLVVFTELKT